MLTNSSFAVKPELFTDERHVVDVKPLHPIQHISVEAHWIVMATPNGDIQFQFPRHDIVRARTHCGSYTALSHSHLENFQPIVPSVTETDVDVHMTTETITLKLEKQTGQFTVCSHDAIIHHRGFFYTKEGSISLITAQQDECIFGLGEKAGWLNKKGERHSMWNTDAFLPHTPDTSELYQSIPVYTSFTPTYAFGLFLNNGGRTIFDFKNRRDEHKLETETGEADVFLYSGPTMKHILEQHTFITGRPALPPKWAVGYHQSRHSYRDEKELQEIVATFEALDIPVDAIFLDILYMDGYRVFTFDEERFPNYETLLPALHEKGIHIVPIVDPGVKVSNHYPTFKEGVLNDYFVGMPDGSYYIGDVWPGKSAFPDFSHPDVRTWWGEKHEFYTRLGIKGIWNDMNEPSVFCDEKTMDGKAVHNNDGQPLSHREYHNVYGYNMSKATAEGLTKLTNERPFVLTRAGYAGIQKHAVVWTGDNRSFWEHLAMTIPMCLNLGLSGVSTSGPDIGGFMNDTEPELLTRWTQLGAFLPYFRNHCSIGMDRQEPWVFGESYTTIIRDYIQMRYEWMPYFYQQFIAAHENGVPFMRPLLLEYPNDERATECNDQFLVGTDVLVAPIVTRGARARSVYLPKGIWYNYWTDERMEGEKDVLVQANLHELPIFIREGSVIPLTHRKKRAKELDDTLHLHFYVSANGKMEQTIFEDDGHTFDYENDKRYALHISTHVMNDTLHIDLTNSGDYSPTWKTIQLHVHSSIKQVNVQSQLPFHIKK